MSRYAFISRGELGAGGLQLGVTDHAVARFHERVRPTLMRKAAESELLRLIRDVGIYSRSAPDWWVCEDTGRAAMPYAFVLLGSPDVVLTIRDAQATSCVVKGTPSDLARVARRQRRAAEARTAALSRGGGRGGRGSGGQRKAPYRPGAGARKSRRGVG